MDDRCTQIDADGARCTLPAWHGIGQHVFPVSIGELLRRLEAVEEKLDRALEVNNLWDGS